MIQVKSGRGRLVETEREALIAWAKAFNGEAQVWHFRKGRIPEITTLG